MEKRCLPLVRVVLRKRATQSQYLSVERVPENYQTSGA